MKIIILIAMLTISAQSYAQEEETTVKDIVSELIAICEKQPNFIPQTIDIYNKKTSNPYEARFYELAKMLHSRGKESSDYLFNLTKTEPNKSKCIYRIFNTWPG